MDALHCCNCKRVAGEGLKVNNHFLCAECESRLVKCEADKIDYEYWINVCRKLWEEVGL